MKILTRLAIGASLLLAGTAASAQDGDDWKFQLVNRSGVAVSAFYTIKRDGKWSTNWIKAQIAPQRTFNMSFFDAKDERCEVRTRIVFTDGSEFDTPVDYCGITKVIVNDETMFSE